MNLKRINTNELILSIENSFWQVIKNDDYEVWRGSDDKLEHAIIIHVHSNSAIMLSFPLIELDLYFLIIDMFIREL